MEKSDGCLCTVMMGLQILPDWEAPLVLYVESKHSKGLILMTVGPDKATVSEAFS